MWRRGFSLVEVMVAAVLAAVGIVAALGTARAAIGLAELGQGMAVAAAAAASRLDELAVAGGAASGGSAASGAVRVAWSVAALAPRRASVVVSVPVEGRIRTARFEALLPCQP
jgi:prepilin-type N-terminal cleavage/methylation domain-containing protein